ncbi:MAG: hypothetical protein ACRDBG_13285 [Waterburya sp.]
MKYLTIKRNKISNTYKATEVSERRFDKVLGFKFTLPDDFDVKPLLQVYCNRIVVVNL